MTNEAKPPELLTFNPLQGGFKVGGARFGHKATLIENVCDREWIFARYEARYEKSERIPHVPGVYCFAKKVTEDQCQAIYVGKTSSISRRMQDYRIGDRFLVTSEITKKQLERDKRITSAIRKIIFDGGQVTLWVAYAHLHLDKPICYDRVEAKILQTYHTLENQQYGKPFHHENKRCLLCRVRAIHELLSSIDAEAQHLQPQIEEAKMLCDEYMDDIPDQFNFPRKR